MGAVLAGVVVVGAGSVVVGDGVASDVAGPVSVVVLLEVVVGVLEVVVGLEVLVDDSVGVSLVDGGVMVGGVAPAEPVAAPGSTLVVEVGLAGLVGVVDSEAVESTAVAWVPEFRSRYRSAAMVTRSSKSTDARPKTSRFDECKKLSPCGGEAERYETVRKAKP